MARMIKIEEIKESRKCEWKFLCFNKQTYNWNKGWIKNTKLSLDAL